MIARADLLLHRTRDRAGGERLAGEDVIEPPADVPLPHVAPRRPPGEQAVVVGVERAADVHEAAAEDALDDRALLRQLADRAWLSFLRVHVAVRPRDVHVAHQHDLARRALKRRGVGVHRLEELHLAGKILAAVGHVDGRDGQVADVHGDDAVLVVEGGVGKGRPLGRERFADVQGDAGVPLAAVPVAPIALHLAEGRRYLFGRGFDFLQADDVRALLRDPLVDLRLSRPDAVDVPGRELEHCRLQISDFRLIEIANRNLQSAICNFSVRTARVPPDARRQGSP